MKDLECISTALQGEDGDARARQFVGLKPHISYDEAKEAVCFVDEMIAEAEPVIRSSAGETV